MISEVTQKDLPRFVKIAAADDLIGMRLLSALRCYGLGSPVCRFYLVNGQAACMVLGSGALLCGNAPDVDELEQFLKAVGATNFKSNLTMLYNWNIVPQLVMQYTAAPPPLPPSLTVDEHPNLWDIAQNGLPGGVDADAWYADTCLRVNKGEAAVYAVERDGAYVATAGVYSRDERSAYLTAVATHPDYRKQGLATALVQALCRAHSDRRVYLLCSPALRKFYEKRGFSLVIPLCEFTI